MRQRGILLILAATALVSLLAALSLHQDLIREREQLLGAGKARQTLERRLAEALGEIEKLKATSPSVETVAKQSQGLWVEVKETLQALQSLIPTKFGETSAAIAEIKGQITAPGTGILARLEELGKLKDHGAQLTVLIAALEAKLKEKDALLQTMKAEAERQAEEIRRRDGTVAAVKPSTDGPTQRAPGRESNTRSEEKPAPAVPIVTSVEASEGSSGVVVLGAGKKSGLEAGHVLSITRDGKAIGRVKVIKVYDDLAGAEIIETVQGESVQASDRASTAADKPPQTPPKVETPLSKAPPPPPPLPGGTTGSTAK